AFWSPKNIVFGLPCVCASAAEPEGLEPHIFERDITGKDHQVSPRNLAPIFLLDRPQQPACLVEVYVVRPTVERREALLPSSGSAAAVANAICSGAVPRHANEQAAIVAEVCRPPILRVGHKCVKV